MSERTHYPAGVPCWITGLQSDCHSGRDFYWPLFGWRFEPGPLPEGGGDPYYLVRLDGREVVGLAPAPAGVPPVWMTSVSTDDVELTAERGDLLLAAIPPGAQIRYASPVQIAYWNHLVVLLDPLVGVERAPYLADALLAVLAPELVVHQLRRGIALPDLQLRFTELAERLLAGG